MIATRLAVVCAIALLSGVFLAGCGIEPEARLTDLPRGGTPPGALDEQSDENIIAYFYAGMPVKGLTYSCSPSNIFQDPDEIVIKETDINGRFVCPRDHTVSFFVGVAGVKTLKLGEVELSTFGVPSSPNKRNNVVITPATLYGSGVSGSKHEVANIFNLLHSLDVQFLGSPGRKQKIIDLEPNMLSSAIGDAAFARLVTGKVSALPSAFDANLRSLVTALSASHNLTLTTTRTGAPTLGLLEAVEVADAALLRARSGLYRTASTMFDSQTGAIFLGTSEFIVGADGMASGLTITEEYSSASPSVFYVLNVLELDPAARVLADGSLQGVTFGSGLRQLDFFGSLINDAIWGESRLCQPDSPNEFVPALYCNTLESNGGFSLLDVGVFESALGFDGELFVAQPLSSRPDVDLDNLPLNFLPRTYELELSRYTDIQFGDLNNPDYDGVNDNKTAFGLPPEVMPQKLRYTLMPNGDIVSDVDGDCSDLSIVNGRYEDENSREYLLGRIGSVFLVDVARTPSIPEDDTPYIDLYFNVLDAAHPNYGLSIGLGAMYRGSLHAMVMEAATGELRSKSCDPTATTVCTDKVEWFDNITYVNQVYAVDRSTRSELTATDEANYKNIAYYGQVSHNDQVIVDTGGLPEDICRP